MMENSFSFPSRDLTCLAMFLGHWVSPAYIFSPHVSAKLRTAEASLNLTFIGSGWHINTALYTRRPNHHILSAFISLIILTSRFPPVLLFLARAFGPAAGTEALVFDFFPLRWKVKWKPRIWFPRRSLRVFVCQSLYTASIYVYLLICIWFVKTCRPVRLALVMRLLEYIEIWSQSEHTFT